MRLLSRALGARRVDVLQMVIWQGMRLVFAGLGLGLLVALAIMRLIKNMIFGISVTDPLTFAVVSLLLAFVALLTCWIPARAYPFPLGLIAISAHTFCPYPGANGGTQSLVPSFNQRIWRTTSSPNF
jgi:FtsX-like permease family